MTSIRVIFFVIKFCHKPKKPWNGLNIGCCLCYYCSILGWAFSRSWSSFDLQTGQLSCSLSHVLRQVLSNAWPHGSSQLSLLFEPTFSKQMLQSAYFSAAIGGKLFRYSSETPRVWGYWSPETKNIRPPANIP